ncbi:uncharacterized protein LOC111244065 isoform X8 [Varroa destructor]|uniref:Transport and Golgi organization protein 1 n=1 Tax=Varroa destructor TaxID=109461 RepID=A0A7M7J9C2_VARDE|nr:uncharacterized protein LOC111244065 isoform X8 [Varroa destructor]
MYPRLKSANPIFFLIFYAVIYAINIAVTIEISFRLVQQDIGPMTPMVDSRNSTILLSLRYIKNNQTLSCLVDVSLAVRRRGAERNVTMAHPVVKFAEILALIFLFASVLSIIWAKDLPKTVKCLDKLCEGSQGETIAPHAVPSDHDLKLSFEESDHLQILGNADKYYLAKDLKTGKVGLVSKTFVKKFDESPHATIEVDLSSLLAERQNVASALQPSPTSDRLCVVDGTTLDGDVCKDPVSTQYTVTVRPNARVAENDDGLKEDERPHEASSSFKPTPGIEDLPASSAPSAESNSFSRNIFQKVYQEFIAPFGQEIELSEVDCGAECLLNTGAIAQDLDGKSAGSAPKTSYNLPSNAVQTKATGTTSKGISVDETRIANRLETNISSYNIVNDEVNVNASIAAAAASVSPETENSDEGKSPKLSTGGEGSENFASDQAIRPEAKKVEKTADTDNSSVTADQPLKPDFNGEKAENPAQNVVTGPLLATAPGEPSEYTVNTLEQTCERKDGVSCDGGPAVPLGQEKHVKLQSAEDEATKSARAKKRRRQDDTLDSAIREYVGLVLSVIPDPLHRLLWDLEEQGVSTHVVVLTFLCGLVGSFLLIFFNCISMNSKEGTLSDYIARLEQQLFALKKEREILLETKDTGHGLVVGTTGGDQALPNELIEHHERELEMILARANNVEQEVQQLQEQIEQVKAERDAYSDDVNEKLQEYEKELSELRFDVETSRREVERKDRELQVKNGTLSELQASNAELLEEAKIWDERVNELTSREEINLAEMSKLQQLLEEKCAEVEALEESLKSMNIFEKAQEAFSDGDEKEIMKRLVDVQRAQKQSEELMSMNTTLQSELTEAKKQCDRWRTEVDQLKECLQQAEKDKRDSEQKLTVLTEYFKDKELKLQRDVVMHETLRQQKESDALTVSEQLDLYREQTANLQAEVASMKEEIEVSERRYKRHLMEQEKKTHENWMAFKNANKTIEDLNAETQVLRQQIIAAEAAQRTLTQAAALPQDRPRPPPPLPLPKGAQIPLLPLPLLNGLKASEMPSPPSARYTNGARCTPPVGVVPLPTVLYQTKSSSSRHSSERKDHQSHRRREDDHEEGRSERKSRGDKAIDRSEPHRDRNRNRETAERRRERKEQQMLLEREKASPANSASITSGEQQQQSRRGANKASELDRDPSTPSVVGIADSSGICGGSTVKENGSASNGRSVHSGGSKGGVISPELRRTFAHRRSDRTDRGRADCYDRNERNQGDLGDRPNRDYGERSPRDNPRR